jgi:hypothetical protein
MLIKIVDGNGLPAWDHILCTRYPRCTNLQTRSRPSIQQPMASRVGIFFANMQLGMGREARISFLKNMSIIDC